ncbi:hypothetical protein [Luteimonas sp. MC1828]|uniref:hypothetical protein n=1 Tax=Luteimonas sp. MC1828 TaxID=2799787 RepID=UPI0018F19B5E|nr:hypothetical protein [Luteimonas sp. MC1828]MBJ7575496.1 hypothetical protein [Luteimonas sp. MC1828]
MLAREYGIICNSQDEKLLVKNVNSFLASVGYRKVYKSVPRGIRNPASAEPEPRYSHYYSQFLKAHPRWYFDLYPNVDLDDRARFPANLDCGWTLYVNKVMAENNSASDDQALETFFADLAHGTGFETVVLHTYGPDESRK